MKAKEFLFDTIEDIDGKLYVCGSHRQVYECRAGKWVSIADDILTSEAAEGFNDIDQHLRLCFFTKGDYTDDRCTR